MAAGPIKVKNTGNSAPSTAGFPKATQNKKMSNKATVPATMKKGGMMAGSKKKCM